MRARGPNHATLLPGGVAAWGSAPAASRALDDADGATSHGDRERRPRYHRGPPRNRARRGSAVCRTSTPLPVAHVRVGLVLEQQPQRVDISVSFQTVGCVSAVAAVGAVHCYTFSKPSTPRARPLSSWRRASEHSHPPRVSSLDGDDPSAYAGCRQRRQGGHPARSTSTRDRRDALFTGCMQRDRPDVPSLFRYVGTP